jgi:hypothetical protein
MRIFLVLVLLASAPVFASYPVGCEMAQLKVVTEVYSAQRAQFGKVFSIKNLTFDYDAATERSFVRLEGSASPFDPKQICSLKVFMKRPTGEPAPGCAPIEFDEVVTECVSA